MRIYKYEVPVPVNGYKTSITIPTYSKVLTAKAIGDSIYIYCEVNYDNWLSDLPVYVIPTGVDFTPRDYIGTVFLERSSLVFHIYTDLKSGGWENI